MVTLIYWNKRNKRNAKGDLKDECQLGYHCDNGYDQDGNQKMGNTQKSHTSTCVVSLGDSRTFHMMEASYNGELNMKPTIIKYLLEHGDLFILHYSDEVPKFRGGKNYLTRMKHGGIHFGKDGGMSGGLVLRSVDTFKLFNADTGKVVNKQPSVRKEFLKREHQCLTYINSPQMLAQFKQQKQLAIKTAAKYKY